MSVRFASLSLLGSVAGLLCGCSGEPGETPITAQAGHQTQALLESGAPSFVALMEGVLDRTHFKGVRVVWSQPGASSIPSPGDAGTVGAIDLPRPAAGGFSINGRPRTPSTPALPWSGMDGVSTRQAVSAGGDGQYAIELLDILELPPGMNEFVFPLAFEASVGAQWNVREFRVRDVQLFQQNYLVTLSGTSSSVAGIPCQGVVIRRQSPIGGRPGHFELDVDPTTGFVLAMREFGATGELLQGFVYERFEYGADLSGAPLRQGQFGAQPVDLGASIAAQLGFRPLVPDLFPEGFELFDASRFEVPEPAPHSSFGSTESSFLPSGEWVRFDATDGLELVRFAHGATDRVDDPSLVKASVLRVLQEGTWEVAFAKVRGVSIVVTGRVGLQGLRHLVESAF